MDLSDGFIGRFSVKLSFYLLSITMRLEFPKDFCGARQYPVINARRVTIMPIGFWK